VAPSWGAIDRCCSGDQSALYLAPNEWVASVTYRYFDSFRDFNSSGQQVSVPLIKNETSVDAFVVSATYAVNRRLNLELDFPIQYGSRTNMDEHDGVHVHTMRASGVGDLRLSANVSLLDPAKHPNQNISLGLGVKAPTGDDAARDYSFRPTGPELRPVDPAIEPGDGGWGILLSGNAFALVCKDTFAYANGSYLINPRNMNGVHTINYDVPDFTAGDRGLMFNSVPDGYFARAGLTHGVWAPNGFDVSLGGRIDGVPVHDLIGGSNGWRLPGFSVSIEPGISFSRGRDFFGISTPVALYRQGLPSVPLTRTHNPLVGIASFSDFQINLTYSHLF
jgi:hypothetical protein